MIIETGTEVHTVRAGDVSPGEVVTWNDQYWIRGDAWDEYQDPMFVRLNDGEVAHPDENKLVTPVPKAKVVV